MSLPVISADSSKSRTRPPVVSVIIATRNRPRELATALEGLKNQAYDEYEVIVVDQSDSFEARPIEQGRERRLHCAPLGAAAARNLGLRHALGEVIVFIDDDVIINTLTFISEHALAYEDPRVGAVCGRCLEAVPRREWGGIPRVWPVLHLVTGDAGAELGGYVGNVKGANMSFRKEVLDVVGGFDERFGAPCMYEETDVALGARQLGWMIAFRAGAVLTHLGAVHGGQRDGGRSDCRYIAYRDRVLLFVKHTPRYMLPLFILGNALLALHPLLRGDWVLVRQGLGGLAAGLRSHVWGNTKWLRRPC